MGDRAYKQRHIAQGLCPDCSRPAVPGKTYCTIHSARKIQSDRKWFANPKNRERKRLYSLRQREVYRKSNRCIMCSAPLGEQDEGCVTCINCRLRAIRATRSYPPIMGAQLENYYKKIAEQS